MHPHPRGYDSYRSPYQGNIDTAENSPAVPLKGRRSGSDEALSPAAPARKVRCAQALLGLFFLKWELFYEAKTQHKKKVWSSTRPLRGRI
jgi:hypothetical protein